MSDSLLINNNSLLDSLSNLITESNNSLFSLPKLLVLLSLFIIFLMLSLLIFLQIRQNKNLSNLIKKNIRDLKSIFPKKYDMRNTGNIREKKETVVPQEGNQFIEVSTKSFNELIATYKEYEKLNVSDKTLRQLKKLLDIVNSNEKDISGNIVAPREIFILYIKYHYPKYFKDIQMFATTLERNKSDDDAVRKFLTDTSMIFVPNSLSGENLSRLVEELSNYLKSINIELIAPLPNTIYNDNETNRVKIVSSTNVNQVNTLVTWGAKKNGKVIKKADIYAGN